MVVVVVEEVLEVLVVVVEEVLEVEVNRLLYN